ncbi:TBC1 domain family member 25-like isoform X2 [Symsagittifera roscoffensis]|uniref:TBC1 domain family member 25-like isoform X2 n=1 Tax=Symsagittifera roscoffensis TaxID=84072 RepID=UPI00307C6539
MTSDFNAYFNLLPLGTMQNLYETSTLRSKFPLPQFSTYFNQNSTRDIKMSSEEKEEERHLRLYFSTTASHKRDLGSDDSGDDVINDARVISYQKNFKTHLIKHLMLLEYDPILHDCEEEKWLDSNGLDDWDIIQSSDVSYYRNSPYSPSPLSPNRRRLEGVHGDTRTGAGAPGPGETKSLLQNPLEETLSRMTRALNMGDKRDHGFRYLVPPLKDNDFRNYLDEEGCLVKPDELRLLVYQIGVEHSLRKVVWKHLLNVYPTKPRLLTGAERYDYMKKKCDEYHRLKKRWQQMNWENKKSVVSSIRKDVLRTDRSHAFFSDIEIDFEKTPTNPHLTSLFDILMTFAMSFPQISYCQGMSDLASPLLLIMQDEAVTYVCFCALMRRLQQNFTVDSRAMHIKFEHLKLLLRYVDKEFYDYLSSGADNNFELFFCYRWLLLEMKREFALDDALLMLEVMWASIPPDPPDTDIKLANEPIVADLENQCNSTTVSSSGLNGSASSHQMLDASLVNRLSALDASNQDLLNWSMEQNVKTQVPSSSKSHFAHLSSKQPLDENGSLRSSNSCDENVENSAWDRAENVNGEMNSNNLQSSGRSDILAPTNQAQSTPLNNNVKRFPFLKESQGIPKQSSLDQITPSLMENHVDNNNVQNGHKMNHSLSCPVLDNEAVNSLSEGETSDLGTTESYNECNGHITENDGADQLPTSSKTASDRAAIGGKALLNSYPLSQKSSVLNTSRSSSSLSPGIVELKRAKSDLEVSPNSLKKQKGEVFSYEEGTSSSAQVSSLASLNTEESTQTKPKLPPPAEFGCGNPFLLFMCVTLIVQQKQKIIGGKMDITEVSGNFFRLVRSHDVHKVLSHARMLFADYLRKQPWLDDSDC